MLQHTSLFFFFNDTATTEIYTLSLHDALPILQVFGAYLVHHFLRGDSVYGVFATVLGLLAWIYLAVEMINVVLARQLRSEEHTSELQSHLNLVCLLLLQKKNLHTPSCSSATDP